MNILEDYRPIKGIYYGSDLTSGYTVGHAGITDIKIAIYGSGPTQSRWFDVYKEDIIISRINMSYVAEITY